MRERGRKGERDQHTEGSLQTSEEVGRGPGPLTRGRGPQDESRMRTWSGDGGGDGGGGAGGVSGVGGSARRGVSE